jgi:prepilin-type N-terminal cleavage/methylation domain-containing protein
MERGFSLIEVLMVLATIAVLVAIALPMYQDALLRANTSSLATDAKALYVAIKQYYVDNNTYPPTGSFELDSFEPLISMGYYRRAVTSRLAQDRADAYFGSDDEFWLEMTLKTDPSVRYLVADSANAPIAGGAMHDGVFLYLDGQLTEIGQLTN